MGQDVPSYLDLVRIAQSERTEMRPRIPTQLVPLLNDGAGNHYCLDTDRMSDGECPVVFWNHELPEAQRPEVEAADFIDWLRERVR